MSWQVKRLRTLEILFRVCSSNQSENRFEKTFSFLQWHMDKYTYIEILKKNSSNLFNIFLLSLNFKNLTNCLFFFVLNYYVKSFSPSISVFDLLFTVNTCTMRSTKVRHLNKVTASFSILITIFPYILTGRSTQI